MAGRVSAQTFGILAMGLAKNPMIVSVVLGIAWGARWVARTYAPPKAAAGDVP